MNRRQLISYTLGTGAVLTVSLCALSLQGTTVVEPPKELQILSTKEYSILFAVADILIPQNPPFPAASAMQVALKVDMVISTAIPEQQEQFKLVLALIENPSISTLLNFQTKPFTQSTESERQHRLKAWRTGPFKLRSAFKALNGMCNAAYYASKEVETLVGYNGPSSIIQEIRKAKGYP